MSKYRRPLAEVALREQLGQAQRDLEAGRAEYAALQSRLAQCEGEKVALAHDRDNWLYRCHSVEDERTELRAERDAALERFGKLTNEARSYVTNRMYYSREEATKDLDKREKILIAVIEESEKALLALRAGMR